MKFDRDQLLIEMHADVREIRTRIEEFDELKNKVSTIEKKITWLQGVAAALGGLLTLAITLSKTFLKSN